MSVELNTIAPKKWVDDYSGAAPTIDTTDGVSVGDFAVDTSNDAIWRCTDNTDTAAVWEDVSASGGGVTITEFRSSGTWTKPAGLVSARILLISGGGGGGSGRKGVTSSNRGGGAGGTNGGVVLSRLILADELGASFSVTVGAGGAGGVAQTTNSADGNAGSDGGQSSISDAALIYAPLVGEGGNGGDTNFLGVSNLGADYASISEGVNSAHAMDGGKGQYGSSDANAQGALNASPNSTLFQSGSGGGGTGATNSNVIEVGGDASIWWYDYNFVLTAPTVAAGGNDANGTDGYDAGEYRSSGGGGGGGSLTTGRNGGAGGNFGGGGGGGGNGTNGVHDSGAGGDGGDGIVVIYEYS